MQSRRNIRIKTMQTVYAYEKAAYPSLPFAENKLKQAVGAAYDLVLLNLKIFVETAQYVLIEERIRKSKHLPTIADNTFSTKFNENQITQTINNNSSFHFELKKRNLNALDCKDVVRSLFKSLYEHPDYAIYSISEESRWKDDLEILNILYHDIMLSHPLYENLLDEHFPNIDDDITLAHFITKEILHDLKKKKFEDLLHETVDTSIHENFALQLFRKTIETKEALLILIKPQLKNWDYERVAQLDMIILRMALCEILYFENIPIKVSLNEYIDIAKDYSSPKSKDFVNGIIDSIMHLLKKENKIIKSGRGLVEE